eukprot:scaffold287763_cov17-Prasinocladus_malaysianus.AAC.1
MSRAYFGRLRPKHVLVRVSGIAAQKRQMTHEYGTSSDCLVAMSRIAYLISLITLSSSLAPEVPRGRSETC